MAGIRNEEGFPGMDFEHADREALRATRIGMQRVSYRNVLSTKQSVELNLHQNSPNPCRFNGRCKAQALFLAGGVPHFPERAPLHKQPSRVLYNAVRHPRGTQSLSSDLFLNCLRHNKELLPSATMKAVPSPGSASKVSSHARPRIASAFPPRQTACELTSRAAQHVGVAHNRGVLTATHAVHRTPQHARRSSGSRPLTLRFDTKINKPSHRSRVGLWLENVDACRPVSSPTPTAHAPPCPGSDRVWRQTASRVLSPETARLIRDPSAPRTPLADITHFVLAAESASNFWSSDTVNVESPRQPSSPCLAPDITGDIDLLTADEARGLLLLSAQSNMSLATAIRGIALNRSSRRSMAQVEESDLADTFRFDEDEMMSHV